MATFTTKIHKNVGKYKSFETKYADVKTKGIVVGNVSEDRSGKATVRFMFSVEPTEEKPCPFKNVKLTKEFDSFEQAINHVRSMAKPSWFDQLFIESN